MTMISFDPRDPDQVAFVRSMLDKLPEPVPTPEPEPPTAAPEPQPQPEPEPEIDPVAGVELDSNGTPWLKEAHAGNKAKNQDGSWRKKRGVDPEVVAKLEAEARDKIASTPQPVRPTEPVVPESDIPVEAVSLDQLGMRWAEKHIDPADAMTHYANAGVDPTTLAVNETARRRLYDYLETI